MLLPLLSRVVVAAAAVLVETMVWPLLLSLLMCRPNNVCLRRDEEKEETITEGEERHGRYEGTTVRVLVGTAVKLCTAIRGSLLLSHSVLRLVEVAERVELYIRVRVWVFRRNENAETSIIPSSSIVLVLMSLVLVLVLVSVVVGGVILRRIILKARLVSRNRIIIILNT